MGTDNHLIINQLEMQIDELKLENTRMREYAQKALACIEKGSEITAKLVLRKMIKGEELNTVILEEVKQALGVENG